ncbi:glycosyltransferase family 4 protein [Microbacterium aurum]
MTDRIAHALTPGDHFSPRTGSAIPTVVHGLAGAAADEPTPRYTHQVLVDADTYRPRYSTASAIEYLAAAPPSRAARARDVLAGRLGLPRMDAARVYAPLVAALEPVPPSVVIAHNAPVLPRLLERTAHRTVLYAHNDILRTVTRAEARRSLDGVAAIVCVSADLADVTADRLPPMLAGRVRVVDNGVDTRQFTPPVVASPGDRLRVLFVGRTIADKGPDVLLQAALLLDRDDLEVHIVGSYGFARDAALSRYEEGLRRQAADLRVPVVFEPFVDRALLPDLLRTADVFVAPSRWREPSGLTIGEALATGLPVIASRVGGIPEVLGDTGILVPPDNPAALAEAIAHLADDHAARARLARAARARAEARDWSHSWGQLRAVLDVL